MYMLLVFSKTSDKKHKAVFLFYQPDKIKRAWKSALSVISSR